MSFLLWLYFSCASEPAPIWLAADLHVHSSIGSNDTDGLGTADVIAGYMQKAGLDLLWLTDHSNSLGSMHCDDVEDCPNLGPERTAGEWPSQVLLGVELSPRHAESDQPVGHVGCFPQSGGGFETTFVDRPFSSVSGRDTVQQCAAAGGFSIVNHPFGPAQWVAFDWTTEDFDGLEVFNGGGGFDPSDAKAVARWEEGVSAGHTWVPVGASDSHRWLTEPPGTLLDPALGWPRTWIGVLPGQSPLEALRAGRVRLGDPSSNLKCWAEKGRDRVWPGGTMEGPVTLFAEATVEDPGLLLEVIELSPEGSKTLYSEPINGGRAVELELDQGTIYVRVWHPNPAFGVRGVAMCNRMVIE